MATAEDRIDVVACWFADNKAIARAGFTKITRRVLAEFADRRSSPERTADGVAETLTSRERDMLSLLSEGLSNQEIADRLFIEPSTVKYHVAGLLAKIGARDRLQAVVWAFRNGLDATP